MTISEIKKSAKTKLSGSYLKCTSCTLLYFTIVLVLTYLQNLITNSINNSIVITIIEAIFIILSLIIGYGLIANIIKLTDEKTNAITDFINLTLKNLGKYTKTLLNALIKLLIPLCLFILSVFYLIGNFVSYANNLKFLCFSPNLIVFSIILTVIAFIIFIYFLLNYALIPYIYYTHSEYLPNEIVNKSKELIKGKKLQFILLLLSFINWLLIAGIVMLILNIFIPTGYLTTFVILFYSLLKPFIVVSKLEFYESLGE